MFDQLLKLAHGGESMEQLMGTEQRSERNEKVLAEIMQAIANPRGGIASAVLAILQREFPAAPPAEGREGELRRILDDIRVAARVENRAFRLKSIDDLVAAALTPKGPTP